MRHVWVLYVDVEATLVHGAQATSFFECFFLR